MASFIRCVPHNHEHWTCAASEDLVALPLLPTPGFDEFLDGSVSAPEGMTSSIACSANLVGTFGTKFAEQAMMLVT